jgi:hypothetical protein
MILLDWLRYPMSLPPAWTLWMLIPLCVSVAVVYKTCRVEHPRELPRELVILVAYMLGGLTVLGVGLWLIQKLFL